jgi:hypothetical protein
VDQVQSARARGYRFVHAIQNSHVQAIHALWGSTFGWSAEGVHERGITVSGQRHLNPENRSSWFSGLVNARGELVAAAVAERLDMHAGYKNEPLALVESSEWRRRDDLTEHGLMAATVSYLHAQVLRDLPNPLIFAETNFRTNAHRVGFGAGMEVPKRTMFGMTVPQILVQNVEVGDGQSPVGLRDFTMLYVPRLNIDRLYSPVLRQDMLREESV